MDEHQKESWVILISLIFLCSVFGYSFYVREFPRGEWTVTVGNYGYSNGYSWVRGSDETSGFRHMEFSGRQVVNTVKRGHTYTIEYRGCHALSIEEVVKGCLECE